MDYAAHCFGAGHCLSDGLYVSPDGKVVRQLWCGRFNPQPHSRGRGTYPEKSDRMIELGFQLRDVSSYGASTKHVPENIVAVAQLTQLGVDFFESSSDGN